MGQAKAQFEQGNDLCWSSLSRAEQLVSSLPLVQRILFTAVFLFSDRTVLPFLVRARAVVRSE